VIRAIIFDCFGVLTTDTWRAFVDSLPDDVDVQKARDANKAYDAGLINREEFLSQVRDVTGREPKQVEDFLDKEVAKNTALLDYIRELRARGLLIGMLSNIASDWITRSFLTAEEQELFDEMIFSYEVGMTKPDPRIFMLACERLRVGPHEAVMVDDIATYCDAATTEGLQAIVYEDLSQLKHELEHILSRK
jgi:epoxide hydrolase-like predicted phosphatase